MKLPFDWRRHGGWPGEWPRRFQALLFEKSRRIAGPKGLALRALRYPVAVIRDLLAGEISVRAASLAYTTLLSLVPLLVVAFVILKAVGARGDLPVLLRQFFRPMGSGAAELTATVMRFVTNMRGDVLGTIGVASLIYTVINTIQNVEASFNYVWRVQQPRSVGRRLAEYLSAVVLGPLVLAAVVGLLGSAEHSPFAHWITAIAPLAWLTTELGHIVPYAVVIVVFSFLYVLVPNTKVRLRPALIGGVTAGVLWALSGKVFAEFIFASSRMVAIYTGFAVVLTTLIWVYLSWLILLIGALFAYYLQCPESLHQGRAPAELGGRASELAALSAMLLIGRDHAAGAPPWTANRLATALGVSGTMLGRLLANLQQAGLIAAAGDEALVPARELSAVRVIDVIEAVRAGASADDTHAAAAAGAARAMAEVDAAIRATLGSRLIVDLYDEAPKQPGAR